MKFQLLIVAAAAVASLAYAADEDDSKSCKSWSKQFCDATIGNAKYVLNEGLGILGDSRFNMIFIFANKIF
jgi:hypothetical protein